MRLGRDDIARILRWVGGCDGESYIDDPDWPLIVRLAESIGTDPAEAAPHYVSSRLAYTAGLTEALYEFQGEHGRWPTVDEQARIRDRLGLGEGDE